MKNKILLFGIFALLVGVIAGGVSERLLYQPKLTNALNRAKKAEILNREYRTKIGTLEREIKKEQADFETFKREIESRLPGLDRLLLQVEKMEKYIKKVSKESDAQSQLLANIHLANARRTGIDPLFAAAAWTQESSFKQDIPTGPAKEEGIGQITPGVWEWLGKGDIHNPADNLRCGFDYLVECNKKAKGDKELILAYYNAGLNLSPEEAKRRAANHIKKVMAYYRKIKRFMESETYERI